MKKLKLKVLLAEDKPGGSLFWEQILAEVRDTEIEFFHIEHLSNPDKNLGENVPDIILLDLTLPAGGGLEVFRSVYAIFPAIPIIVVIGNEDQTLAIQTALEGAQDCLLKRSISGFLLSRAMRYAIGRQKHLIQLKEFLLIDELTGLYNRRGFLGLAEKSIQTANRTGESLLLVFADVDGLKPINDTLGHHRGDLALMETAHVLREAFRETDILGRLSGDEFVALLTCGSEVNEESLRKRFEETMEEHNAFQGRTFELSISIGIALYDPKFPCSAVDLLAKADSVMYHQKKVKKGFGDFRLFDEMKAPVRAVMTEFLAETQDEDIVRLIIPILLNCGLDQGLSLQISAWIAKGSRDLKLNLMGMVAEMGAEAGGPVLRLALLDDSEEIAALAARLMGKIHFVPALRMLIKAFEIRKIRFTENDFFLTAVCRSLGDLAQPEGIPFLEKIAGKNALPEKAEFSLPVRLEALHALLQLNRPEALLLLERLKEEKNPELRETLEKLGQDLRSA